MTRILSAEQIAVKGARNRAAHRRTGVPVPIPLLESAKAAKSLRIKPQTHSKAVSTVDYPAMLAKQIKLAGFPPPVGEWKFDTERKWRFDLAWPRWFIAMECEGGIWMNGRHNRGKGYLADVEKYNAATLQGWRVLRCSTDMVKTGRALELVEWAMKYLKP